MGSPIGLLLTIDADASRAGAALEGLQSQVSSAASSVSTSFSTTAAGPKVLEDNILSARESTRLLSEEFGMHLPRAVSSAMAEVMPQIAALGTALLGAFAAVEGAKLIDSLRGITAEFQKEYDLTVKINDILVGKQSYAQLAREVADNRAELTKLNAEQEKYITGAGKSTEEQGALRHAAIAVTEALTPMPQKFYDNRAEIERINALLPKLTEEMTRAGVAEGKLGIVHEHTTGSLKAHTQSMDAYNESLLRARNSEIEEIDRLTKSNTAMQERLKLESEELQWKSHIDQEKADHKAEVQIAAENDAIAARTVANQRANVQAFADARQALEAAAGGEAKYDLEQKLLAKSTADAAAGHKAKAEALKLEVDMMKAAHAAAVALETAEAGAALGGAEAVASLIGGRKAQAAVEGGFYMAKGAFDIADSIFPFNPALLIKGIGEEAAGLQMLGVGGGGGSRASAAGGGASAGSRGPGVGSGSPSAASGGGGRGSSYPGGRGDLHITVVGNIIGTPDQTQELFDQWSSWAKGGQVYLTANNALTKGPKST